jgi:tight adherence protein C
LLTGLLIAGSAALLAGSITLFCIALHRWVRARLVAPSTPEGGGRPSSPLSILSDWLRGMNRPLLRPRYESAIRRRLIQAGEPRNLGPFDVLTLQEIGLLCGLALGLVASDGLKIHPGASLAFALLGGCCPLFWLRDQVKKRLLRIGRALPYHLDLLTLAVEAGLDFTGALGKVVERGRVGPLRDELQLVLKQLRLGKTREEALKGMILRVDLPPLTQFVRVLIQADKMGTSLGKVLRIQSGQMRAERTQRAEKLANQAPVKMLAPLVGCIFPTVFMILFGPIVFALMFGG